MTGACGQQVLFGTYTAKPHLLCRAVLKRSLLCFAACIGSVKSCRQVRLYVEQAVSSGVGRDA